MTRIEVTRISAYGLLRDADRILLCRLSQGVAGAGMWTLPGGGIEFGEHPEAAMIREVEGSTDRCEWHRLDSLHHIAIVELVEAALPMLRR